MLSDTFWGTANLSYDSLVREANSNSLQLTTTAAFSIVGKVVCFTMITSAPSKDNENQINKLGLIF